jgi:hypothetical protein
MALERSFSRTSVEKIRPKQPEPSRTADLRFKLLNCNSSLPFQFCSVLASGLHTVDQDRRKLIAHLRSAGPRRFMRASVLDRVIGTCSGQKEEGDGAKHSHGSRTIAYSAVVQHQQDSSLILS